ncbi:uncharacterized protein N7511_000856 [Penicillium nucicola]|uniref:uncharacterized protein n=1 Tax=Penicillium nucicola TaxID=1850975 RepID=UPI002545803F|nr:uncharacterized protein N7511_000856 [Penicillium nucicola]KAJ5775845.1 hypothetical protein N7511_000856 [Penicillium nucicola]
MDPSAGRVNKRKRESSDQMDNPVGVQECSEQAIDSSKRASPGETKTTPINAACSLTSHMTQILQHDTSFLSSSAVELLDLYLCLWDCYTIKSASKIRLEEERRFLQSSQEWLVAEKERLQQCCNHQVLLLWDRRQAFFSVQQGVLGTLHNSERQSFQVSGMQWGLAETEEMCSLLSTKTRDIRAKSTYSTSALMLFLDYDLDLDLESIWREFPNMPTPPPCLAESRSTVSSDSSLDRWPEPAQHGAEKTSVIEYVFYPSYEHFSAFSWMGPDPLSPDTCGDDIFLYVSAFLLLERVDWIEIRLSKLNTETEEAVEEYPFFLPRVESMLSNLRRIRDQVNGILSQSSTAQSMKSAGRSLFQLAIWPRVEFNATISSSVPLSRIHPSISKPLLDPQVFVQNIVGSWEL